MSMNGQPYVIENGQRVYLVDANGKAVEPEPVVVEPVVEPKAVVTAPVFPMPK
jgi:hypothetical protein